MSIQREYIEEIKSNISKYEREYKEVVYNLSKSTAIYNGQPVDTLFMPKFFTKEQINCFENLIEEILQIINKVINHYLKNESYRRLFPFSPEIEELILKNHGYESLLPIARIDFFYNEENDNFRFCEFNTDGTSAMNEDRELVRIFSDTSIYKKMSKKYDIKSFELIDSWIKEIIDIYKGSDFYNKESPVVGIIDFLDKATLDEFKVFKDRFIAQGYDAIIGDIREIEFKNNSVFWKGKKIDLIYRRAVTSEIELNYPQVDDFISACKSNEVCIVGPIKTQIVHHKSIFKILHLEETKDFLTEREKEFINEHIPYTFDLRGNNKEEVINNKNKWIIKPIDSYGSKGVYSGLDFTQSTWKEIIENAITKDYYVQSYCNPYKSLLPVFRKGELSFEEFNNITGVYVYNGKMEGILSRVGQKAVISGINNGYTLPTFIVDKV